MKYLIKGWCEAFDKARGKDGINYFSEPYEVDELPSHEQFCADVLARIPGLVIKHPERLGPVYEYVDSSLAGLEIYTPPELLKHDDSPQSGNSTP